MATSPARTNRFTPAAAGSADQAPPGTRTDRFAPSAGRAPASGSRMPQARTNSVSASQARAAQRREARRGELAVAAWLRELSGRGR
jgi:hypothetical protein